MYEWLKVNHLRARGAAWIPLTADNKNISFPLHIAIEADDSTAIDTLLKEGNIYESDFYGNTLLHLSIKQQNFPLFECLLAMGADPTLCNGKDHSLLHQAAIYDKEGRFLEVLLQKNLPINQMANYLFTPLAIAIESQNDKAIEMLKAAGGED